MPEEKPKPFWTRRYRLYCWFQRRFWARDLLLAVMTAATIFLTIHALSQKFAPYVAAVYLAAVLGYYGITLHQRGARDRLQADVLWSLFHQINQNILADDPRSRFTFFKEAPGRSNEVIAWYRYQKGAKDAISAARVSRAHYRRGEGVTGRAWDRTGRLLVGSFPKFNSRQELVARYVDGAEIRKEVAEELSDYMLRAQTIFAYGFVDSYDKFLGILSLDLSTSVDVVADGDDNRQTLRFQSDSRELVTIDPAAMQHILDSVRCVVEVFNLHGGKG